MSTQKRQNLSFITKILTILSKNDSFFDYKGDFNNG